MESYWIFVINYHISQQFQCYCACTRIITHHQFDLWWIIVFFSPQWYVFIRLGSRVWYRVEYSFIVWLTLKIFKQLLSCDFKNKVLFYLEFNKNLNTILYIEIFTTLLETREWWLLYYVYIENHLNMTCDICAMILNTNVYGYANEKCLCVLRFNSPFIEIYSSNDLIINQMTDIASGLSFLEFCNDRKCEWNFGRLTWNVNFAALFQKLKSA